MTGTAATGAAVAGGAVEAKCATGSGTATTAGDGSYSVVIAGGALPCAMRVTAGTTVLHGLATGVGASARANLTPVTELAVARLAGDLPSAYFNAFGSAAAAGLTPAAVQAAAAALVDLLKAGGVDFSAAGDAMAGALVVANGSTPGNPYDRALDALTATLASRGTTLAALVQTVAVTAPVAPTAARSNVASLPADLLLKAKAANCDALRSGDYRLVVQEAASTASTEVLTLDAAALTVKSRSNESVQLTATGPCSYSTPEGAELVVSRAGVIAARVRSTGTTFAGAVLMPEQSHTLADLAGEWNILGYESEGNAPLHATSGTVTLDAAGRTTASQFCDDLRTCVLEAEPAAAISVNAAGGYNLESGGRLFLYRAGGGELLGVAVYPNGSLFFLTRKAPVVLPLLGRIAESWNLTLTANLTAPGPIALSRNTVAALDTTAGSYVRNAVQNFGTGSTRPETIQTNSLREGYSRRLPATAVSHSDRTVGNVPEWIAMGLRGMDMSVLALTASNQFLISPTRSVVNP